MNNVLLPHLHQLHLCTIMGKVASSERSIKATRTYLDLLHEVNSGTRTVCVKVPGAIGTESPFSALSANECFKGQGLEASPMPGQFPGCVCTVQGDVPMDGWFCDIAFVIQHSSWCRARKGDSGVFCLFYHLVMRGLKMASEINEMFVADFWIFITCVVLGDPFCWNSWKWIWLSWVIWAEFEWIAVGLVVEFQEEGKRGWFDEGCAGDYWWYTSYQDWKSIWCNEMWGQCSTLQNWHRFPCKRFRCDKYILGKTMCNNLAVKIAHYWREAGFSCIFGQWSSLGNSFNYNKNAWTRVMRVPKNAIKENTCVYYHHRGSTCLLRFGFVVIVEIWYFKTTADMGKGGVCESRRKR